MEVLQETLFENSQLLEAAVTSSSLLSHTAVAKEFDRIQAALVAAFDSIDDLKHELEADANIELLARLNELHGNFIDLRASLRKAKLDLKNNQQKLEQEQRATEAAKIAGAELTESMRQATKLMADEVERSIAAVQTLEQSTQLLSKTRAQYSTFQSVLTLSATILQQIHRGSIMDKLVLFGGFGFFLLTVLYIVWKRTWIPGASLVFGNSRSGSKSAVKSVVTTVVSKIARTVTSNTPTPATFSGTPLAAAPETTRYHSHDEL
ncbi:Protein transport protein sec20, partial [Physocladia obscura]